MASKSKKSKSKSKPKPLLIILIIAVIGFAIYWYLRSSSETNSFVGNWSGKVDGVETKFEFTDDRSGVLKQGNKTAVPFTYNVKSTDNASATIDGKTYNFVVMNYEVTENGETKKHTPLLKVDGMIDNYRVILTRI